MNWKFLAIMAVATVLFAVINNVRQPQERKVTWIGGQEVLAKPAAEAEQ